VEAFFKDVSHAVRVMFRNPGFTGVAILSLALGIGANTAVFQLINAVRLRPLPVADPHEIAAVRIDGGNRGLGLSNGFNSDLTFALWQEIREYQQAFSGIFAWGSTPFFLGEGADARLVNGLWVSGDLFPVLKVSPARGRLFTAADDQRGCGAGPAVVSYDFWQSHFGGDEAVVGKNLVLGKLSLNVIGVAPKGFFGLEVGKSFDVALPMCTETLLENASARLDRWWLAVMGRLKPDWPVSRASDHLIALSPGLFETTVPPGYSPAMDESYRKLRLIAMPAGNGASRLRENYDRSLSLLLAITGMVLLVASVNLANLMLARAAAREREIAVRIAIGASRRRIILQSLTESVALAILGGVVGAALSNLLTRGLISLLSTDAERILIDTGADWIVLAFTAAVALFTCVLFGLIPALRSSRVEPAAVIKSGGRGLTTGRERFSIQRLLVASQIAVSLVLLVAALLFVRSFRNLATLDPGFREEGIVFMFVNFESRQIPAPQQPSYKNQLLEEIRSMPGVASAAITSYVPLRGGAWTLIVNMPTAQGEQTGDSRFTYVSPRYFQTMEIPLLAGRDFNDFDTTASGRVAIVNETFVRRYAGPTNPIGAQLRTVAEPGLPATTYEIVGIARDTKYATLREDIPAITFVPMVQDPLSFPFANLVIRSAGEPDELVAALTKRFKELHPDVAVGFTVFEKQIRDGLSRERLMAWLAGFFGVLAAILAVTGLYGLISYILQRRIQEIGIRMALGATRSSVIVLVLRQTAFLVVIGLAVGIPACLVMARFAAALLFGLTPNDIPTLISAAVLLAMIAGLASFAPAWRASRIDPMEALRDE
jgi:putative ABC transport system permease protein